MTDHCSFDVVLPCYNPVALCNEIVLEHFKRLKVIYGNQFNNLIIVNDGSQKVLDPTILKSNISELIWVEYPHNQGKGFALRQGVQKSTAHFCFYTDFDFPFGIEPFKAAHQKLLNGADVVMGNRSPAYYKILPLRRLVISNLTNLMNKLILRIPYKDTQAGLKGFNKKGRELFLQTSINTFLFDTEFIMLACRKKLNIATVQVTPRNNVHFSTMKIKTLKKEVSNFVKLLRMK